MGDPMRDITVSIQLERHEAEAYFRWLIKQYEQAMADCWGSDSYRHTPPGLRAPHILKDRPYLAGLIRTARELRKQLEQQ